MKGFGQDFMSLHIAVAYKAPLEVLKFLVEKYPRALQETLDNGSASLHLALVDCVIHEQTYEVVKFSWISGPRP